MLLLISSGERLGSESQRYRANVLTPGSTEGSIILQGGCDRGIGKPGMGEPGISGYNCGWKVLIRAQLCSAAAPTTSGCSLPAHQEWRLRSASDEDCRLAQIQCFISDTVC